jgi:uncharacterized membrane protein
MEKETARLEAFSDGVFGVAITLLALEIGIKEYEAPTNLSLWHNILQRWPEYFTYFNSFAVVLLIWMGHHTIVKQVRVTNTPAIFLNGLVLLLVALFPFPTRTVGRFFGTEAETTAVALYTGFTGLINLSILLLTLYLRRNTWLLLDERNGLAVLSGLIRWEIVGVTAYAVLATLAFWSSKLAFVGTFFMWFFWSLVVAAADEKRPPG